MGAHEVERGWRDNPYRVLKRSQYVKRQAELIGRRSLEHGYAHRCHVMRAFAIGDLILQGTLYRGRCWCLSACGLNRTHGRRRGATLQKFSTTGFFRVHGSSPWQLYSTSRRDSLLEISDRTEMYAVCAASSIRMRNVWSYCGGLLLEAARCRACASRTAATVK